MNIPVILGVQVLIVVAVLLFLRRSSAGVLKRLDRYLNAAALPVAAKKKPADLYTALDQKMDKVPVLKTVFNAIERTLTVANVPVKTSEFLISILIVMVIALALQMFLSGGAGPESLGAVLGSLLIPFLGLKIYTQIRMGKLRGQLKLCIALLANSMKAGNSFIQALRHVTSDLEDPLAGEFKLLLSENQMGIPIDLALNNMAKRVPCAEMQALVRGVILQQQTGSNLVQILKAISQTLQDRDELRNKISVLTIQGKISGMVCISVPFFLFMMMSKAQEGYSEIMMESTAGHWMLFACGALMSVGSALIYKVVSFKF